MSANGLQPGDEINSLGLDEDGKRWKALHVEDANVTGVLSDGAGSEVSVEQLSDVVEVVQTEGTGGLFLADDGQYYEVLSATSGTYDDTMLKSVYDYDDDGVVDVSALAYEVAGGSSAGSGKYYGTDSAGALGFFQLPEATSGTSGSSATSMSWANVTDKPVAFPPEAHNHDDVYYTETETDAMLADKADATHNHDSSYDSLGSAASVQENLDAALANIGTSGSGATSMSWSNVTDKPVAFPPEAHDHNDVYYTETEIDAMLANIGTGGSGVTSVAWDEVTDKPVAFPPEAHNHDDVYYTETETDAMLADKADATHDHDSNYDSLGSAASVQANLDAALANIGTSGSGATSMSWSNVTDKPVAFPPEAHNHDDVYYTETETDAMLADKADNDHTHSPISLGALEMIEVSALPSTAAAAANIVYALNELGDWSGDTDGFYKLFGSVYVEIGGTNG